MSDIAITGAGRDAAGPPSVPTAPGQSRGTLWWIALFLIPFLIMFLGFTIWPLLGSAWYSLYDWNGSTTAPLANSFVGLQNYTTIAGDPNFHLAVQNTLVYCILETLIKLPLTLGLAILLTQRWLRFKNFFRTMFFLPFILPVSTAGLVFQYILDPTNGTVGAFLHTFFRVPLGTFTPLSDSIVLPPIHPTGLLVIVAVGAWQIFGQYMLYWMAALQGVPEELYEAASLDGAGWWRQLRHITLPMIWPIGVIITILAFVNALKVFGQVLALTNGGPGQATNVVALYILQNSFLASIPKFGYASAASVLFAILAFVFFGGQAFLVTRAQQVRKEYGI
ncbi:MAG TPA: sugar ABC transporter permease [Candidatus Dormibacteraeota bacterium]|jgi:ABC-type sugar transport system permease subunit|nr:sugar ABC transporter permease [Candidatus Dormibacteraeota bacterium]